MFAAAVSRVVAQLLKQIPHSAQDQIANHLSVIGAAFLEDPLGYAEGFSSCR